MCRRDRISRTTRHPGSTEDEAEESRSRQPPAENAARHARAGDRLHAGGELGATCSPRSTRRSSGSTPARTGRARACGKGSPGAAGGASLRDASASTAKRREARAMTEPRRGRRRPRRLGDGRPRRPSRPPTAITRRPALAVARPRGRGTRGDHCRPADEALVSGQLALDEGSRRRAVLDPPRSELGDRVRALLERDGRS